MHSVIRLNKQNKIQNSEALLKSVNESSKTIRNIYISFLFFSIYIILVVANTNDLQLLLLSPITLPLIKIKIPIIGFYVIIPLLYLFFHFYIFLNIYFLNEKLKTLKFNILNLNEKYFIKRLFHFSFNYMFFDNYNPNIINFFVKIMVFSSLVLLPIILLLYIQIGFLPYHDFKITWLHRIIIIADVIMVTIFWTFISKTQKIYNSFFKYFWILLIIFLSCATLTIPDEYIERSLLKIIPKWLQIKHKYGDYHNFSGLVNKVRYRNDFYLTYWLLDRKTSFFHRNLDLSDKILVDKNVPYEIIQKLQYGDKKEQLEAVIEIPSLDLRGRNLSYANFKNTVMPKVDFRGEAINEDDSKLILDVFQYVKTKDINLTHQKLIFQTNLIGANFENSILIKAKMDYTVAKYANFRYADLRFTQAKKADFTFSDFFKSNLSYSQFWNCNFKKTIFTHSKLNEIFVRVSDFEQSDFLGASIKKSKFMDSNFQFAVFIESDLTNTDFYTSNIRLAKFQYAEINGTNFDNTNKNEACFTNENIWCQTYLINRIDLKPR